MCRAFEKRYKYSGLFTGFNEQVIYNVIKANKYSFKMKVYLICAFLIV